MESTEHFMTAQRLDLYQRLYAELRHNIELLIEDTSASGRWQYLAHVLATSSADEHDSNNRILGAVLAKAHVDAVAARLAEQTVANLQEQPRSRANDALVSTLKVIEGAITR